MDIRDVLQIAVTYQPAEMHIHHSVTPDEALQ